MTANIREENTSFHSGSGVTLAATLYHPAQAGVAPGVVVCHGFGARRDERARDVARLLAKRGFRVLAWDYRGFGESGGPTGRVNPFEQIDDGVSAAEFLAARADVDATKMALFGLSLGGGVVPGIMARCDWLSCAVAAAPSLGGSRRMSDYPVQKASLVARAREAIAARAKGQPAPMVDRVELMNPDPEYAKFYTGDPHPVALESFFHITFGFEPLDWAPKINKPFLIVTGAEDKTTPMEDCERFYQALRCEKDLHIFPDGTHKTVFTDRIEAVIDVCEAWYRKHMPA